MNINEKIQTLNCPTLKFHSCFLFIYLFIYFVSIKTWNDWCLTLEIQTISTRNNATGEFERKQINLLFALCSLAF